MNIQKIKIYFLFLSLIIFSFCSPSTDDYILQAKNELSKENSLNAFRLFQRAYESSLPDDFFVFDRERSFSRLEFSAKKEHAVFLEEDETDENKKIKLNRFEFIDFPDDEIVTGEIKGEVYSVSLSPSGKFVIFLSEPEANKNLLLKSTNETEDNEKPKGNCAVFIWETGKRKFHPIESVLLNCREKPGVSDDGKILFVQDEKVMVYDLKQNPYSRLYIESQLEKIVKEVPNLGHFFFSVSNEPYLLYGNYGTYSLYSLKNRELKKITAKASSNKLYFMLTKENPGVFTGGASEHKVEFFDFNSENSIMHSFDVQGWKDASFISNEHFYFLRRNKLGESKNALESELPFWGTHIFSDKHGAIYFLSSLGTAMKLSAKKIPQKSLVIFETARKLDEAGD